MTFWQATLETPNFLFVAYAAQEIAAIELVHRAWERHCEQTGATAAWHEMLDDVHVAKIALGTAYRDGLALVTE